jgi:hypothetical protein
MYPWMCQFVLYVKELFQDDEENEIENDLNHHHHNHL